MGHRCKASVQDQVGLSAQVHCKSSRILEHIYFEHVLVTFGQGQCSSYFMLVELERNCPEEVYKSFDRPSLFQPLLIDTRDPPTMTCASKLQL